jgi:thioredoxin 1
MASEKVVTFTDENFEQEVLQSDVPVFVDFWAEWCGPCLRLAPTIDEIAEEYDGKIKVGKALMDDAPNTAQQFQIMSIPALFIFKDGQPVERIIGAAHKTAIVEKIEEALNAG